MAVRFAVVNAARQVVLRSVLPTAPGWSGSAQEVADDLASTLNGANEVHVWLDPDVEVGDPGSVGYRPDATARGSL